MNMSHEHMRHEHDHLRYSHEAWTLTVARKHEHGVEQFMTFDMTMNVMTTCQLVMFTHDNMTCL